MDVRASQQFGSSNVNPKLRSRLENLTAGVAKITIDSWSAL